MDLEELRRIHNADQFVAELSCEGDLTPAGTDDQGNTLYQTTVKILLKCALALLGMKKEQLEEEHRAGYTQEEKLWIVDTLVPVQQAVARRLPKQTQARRGKSRRKGHHQAKWGMLSTPTKATPFLLAKALYPCAPIMELADQQHRDFSDKELPIIQQCLAQACLILKTS